MERIWRVICCKIGTPFGGSFPGRMFQLNCYLELYGMINRPIKQWEKKDKVRALRQQGFSYHEILSQVPFSLAKSTISVWCEFV